MSIITKVLIRKNKELLKEIRNRDEIIEYLLDTLDKNRGIKDKYVKEIAEKYNVYY